MDHTVYVQLTPHMPLFREGSPDGATTDCSSRHLIAACYSSIYPEGWKAELACLADL